MKLFGHSLFTPIYAIADEGKDWAQYQLGNRYLHGSHGFDMNLPEGVWYMRMAAEKGYAPAQCELMYGNSRGVPQDWDKSFHRSLMAANQGCAAAQHNVGKAYYEGGRGVVKDIDQAFIWMNKADLGYHIAQYTLCELPNVLTHQFDVC